MSTKNECNCPCHKNPGSVVHVTPCCSRVKSNRQYVGSRFYGDQLHQRFEQGKVQAENSKLAEEACHKAIKSIGVC